MAGTKSGDGTYTSWGGTIPSGEIYVITHMYLQNLTGSRGKATLWVGTASSNAVLESKVTPGMDVVKWDGQTIIAAGGNVHVTQETCLDGDVILARALGYKMAVPT